MKKVLFILILAVASAPAQTTTIRPVQHTNGLVVSPTNFWLANSNAINAVVAGGGSGAAWISTNARTAATNLGLGWLGLTNTNGAGLLASAFGSGTNPLVINEGQVLQTPGGGTVTNLLLAATLDWWVNTTARDQTRTNLGLGASWLINSSSPIFPDTNGAATANAWKLNAAPTNGIATIATNEVGIGWDEDARATFQTPVGPITVYETGSPSTPTLYWPGTILAQRFDAVIVNGVVYASQITGGSLGGTIADNVMQTSMPMILRDWQPGGAQSAGWPHVITNDANWPVAGSYVPMGTVTNFGSEGIVGEYWSLDKFRTNLFTGGGVPAGGAPEGAIYTVVGGSYVGVASRTVTRTMTNSASKATNASGGINSVTADEPAIAATTLDANSLYLVTYWIHYETSATNTGLIIGMGFSQPLAAGPAFQRSGWGTTPSSAIQNQSYTAGATVQTFPSPFSSSTQTNVALAGKALLRTGTNSTSATFRWNPANNVTNVLTINAGTTFTFEKISP